MVIDPVVKLERSRLRFGGSAGGKADSDTKHPLAMSVKGAHYPLSAKEDTDL
jgi:hypothetical protein